MKTFLIFALLFLEHSSRLFTDSQSRDIGCVAVVSIISEEQRRDAPGANDYPDLRELGPRWAASVGDRISGESGQSVELVRKAIWDAVEKEQANVSNIDSPKAYVDQRMTTCLALMRADLARGSAPQ
ncbi:hypothetical protein [Parasphingorhabdus sp.]|uniref:hypothetical protein n=1 Tax=Parasphingorhabdus sp. TaxID=2709688 RepID=UPI002B26BB7D|nr:hypothetical protein [Parasphingorhabdus sp.]